MPRSASALASRLARSSSSLNVSRRAVDADPLCACDTTTSRSGTASQTRSKRSARLNPLTARIYDGLSETLFLGASAARHRALAVAQLHEGAELDLADLPDAVLQHGHAGRVQVRLPDVQLVVHPCVGCARERDLRDLRAPRPAAGLVLLLRLLQSRAELVAVLEESLGCRCGRGAAEKLLPVGCDLRPGSGGVGRRRRFGSRGGADGRGSGGTAPSAAAA